MSDELLLMEAVGNINEKYIEGYFRTKEALALKRRRRKSVVRLSAAVAACLAVVLSGLLIFNAMLPPGNEYELYTAYLQYNFVEGVDDSGWQRNVDPVHLFKFKRYEDIPDPKQLEITLTVLGKEYTAMYDGKHGASYNSFYSYVTEEGDRFEINMLGKLHYFASSEYNSIRENDKEETLSSEELLAKVTGILKRLVGEDQAARYSEPHCVSGSKYVWYRFSPAYGNIGGYDISDDISICLNKKGGILQFRMNNAGAFEGKELPDGFNDDRIKEIILASLGNADFDIELSENRALIVLDDGKTACKLNFRPEGSTDGEAWMTAIIPIELKDAVR